MSSKKRDIAEKKSVPPPSKEEVAGRPQTEKNVFHTTGRQEQPLEERKVIQTASATEELDWPLKRMTGRKVNSQTERAEDGAAKPEKEKKPLTKSQERLMGAGRVGQWFQTICFMNIPVLGFIYMLILALRRKTPPQRRSFAIAFILYRMLVMLIALTILYVLYKVGLDFVDEILRYAGGISSGS